MLALFSYCCRQCSKSNLLLLIWIESKEKMSFRTFFVHKKKRHFKVAKVIDFIGRRDWTRTNDPHHVKVVL